ncbi:MAG: SDR family NAD(P)-dependent oxidoreductase, partial [Symploca sp. SIO3E6]|nr:SDR family NAD(P)-dependent oxidoreductase [Caldora sp. SIO3E6]
APIMRRQGCGRIINVSSLSARLSGPLGGLYCATKGAMDRATDALRLELAPWNIRVVIVAPGLTATPTSRRWMNGCASPATGLLEAELRRASTSLFP